MTSTGICNDPGHHGNGQQGLPAQPGGGVPQRMRRSLRRYLNRRIRGHLLLAGAALPPRHRRNIL